MSMCLCVSLYRCVYLAVTLWRFVSTQWHFSQFGLFSLVLFCVYFYWHAKTVMQLVRSETLWFENGKNHAHPYMLSSVNIRAYFTIKYGSMLKNVFKPIQCATCFDSFQKCWNEQLLRCVCVCVYYITGTLHW